MHTDLEFLCLLGELTHLLSNVSFYSWCYVPYSEVYFERMVFKTFHGKVARVGHLELLVILKKYSDLYFL